MYIIYVELLIIYTQVMLHKMYNMQFILMLIMSIIRISCIKLSHTEFWFVMFYKSKIQAIDCSSLKSWRLTKSYPTGLKGDISSMNLVGFFCAATCPLIFYHTVICYIYVLKRFRVIFPRFITQGGMALPLRAVGPLLFAFFL